MKRIIYYTAFITTLILISVNVVAQNPIPSYDVPVIVDPTTFEEQTNSNSATYSHITFLIASNPDKGARSEKELCIRIKDENNSTTAFSEFYIIAIDTTITYGPYYCYEGTVFTKLVSSDYLWRVMVADATSESFMDVWFD